MASGWLVARTGKPVAPGLRRSSNRTCLAAPIAPMPKHPPLVPLVAVASAALVALAAPAQDEGPRPAPQLAKLAPMVGNWTGSGEFHDPEAGRMPWQAQCSYRWSHDGFFVQEDLIVTFDGNPDPLALRCYLGWDAENKRYVNVHVANSGEVGLHEMRLLPDGTFVQMMVQEGGGVQYLERATWKVDGDTLAHGLDMLFVTGASTRALSGTFRRAEAKDVDAMSANAYGIGQTEAMQVLTRAAGDYETVGAMVIMPGMPETTVRTATSFRIGFGGQVLHGHAEGPADGMDRAYVTDTFWGWDAAARRYRTVHVSNLGEVGAMELRLTADGKALVGTAATTVHGEPAAQRFVLEVDDKGAFSRGTGHVLFGTAAPLECLRATYTRKQ